MPTGWNWNGLGKRWLSWPPRKSSFQQEHWGPRNCSCFRGWVRKTTCRVCFWAPGSEPTLWPCHETSRIFMESERILRVAKRCSVIFYRFALEEKGAFGLLGGRPQPISKSPPKKSKGPFFRENELLKWYQLRRSENLGGAVSVSISVIVCDIVRGVE